MNKIKLKSYFRHSVLLTIALATVVQSFSQINIGKSKSHINLYVSELDDEEFDLVKSAKTIIVVPEVFDYDTFVKTIGDIWTINSPEYITQKAFDANIAKYKSTGNIVFYLRNLTSLEAHELQRKNDSRRIDVYLTYRWSMFYYKEVEEKRNGELKYKGYSLAELFFTSSIKYRSDFDNADLGRQSLLKPAKLFKKTKDIDKGDYDEPEFYNLDLGYVKNYFQFLNAKFLNKENFNIRDGYVDKEKIKALKNQILYAPDWILKEYNAMKVDIKGIMNAEELFEDYDYDYKIVSNENLNQMILEGKNIYYLMYTQHNRDKVISVINAKTGDFIYMQEDSAYNIKDSDLKDINKLID